MPREKAISEVLGAMTDDKTVRAQAILEILNAAQSSDEKAKLLSITLLERDSAAKNKKTLKNAGLTISQWNDFNRSHGDMVTGHFKMAFFKSATCTEFSAEVLRLMDFFPSVEEKAYVISRALYSPYVPYHTLPGTPTHMTSEDFDHRLKSEKGRLDLIRYICDLPFEEWTEQASLLLQVITDAPEKESQVVLLAVSLQCTAKRDK